MREWLLEDIHRGERQPLLLDHVVRVAGHVENLRVGPLRRKALVKLVSVHALEDHVREQELYGAVVQGGAAEGGFSVRRIEHQESILLQHELEKGPDLKLVLHDKNRL